MTYFLMNFLMTSAPLAMRMHELAQPHANTAVQWHVVAMYAPSSVVGSLIPRFGSGVVTTAGLFITALAALIGLLGMTPSHFIVLLIVLGAGWNFGFAGASAMVLETPRPEERARVQSTNDFIVLGSVAVGSFLSGSVLVSYGWEVVCLIVFPLVVAALGALLFLRRRQVSGQTRVVNLGSVSMTDRRTGTSLARTTGCRTRRKRFGAAMAAEGLGTSMLTTSAHLAYFFGMSGWRSELAAGVISADGLGVLALGGSSDCIHFADEVVRFEDTRGGTPCDDREGMAVRALERHLPPVRQLGCDAAFTLRGEAVSVTGLVADLRRSKHADELELVTAAVRATEAGYRAIKPLVHPGISELEVYVAFHGAAAVAAGTSLPELGNDFRGGAPGGRPRAVPLQTGDLMPVDAGVRLEHYNADLCRTYAVSGNWDKDQREAFKRVEDALHQAENLIRVGTSCRTVYDAISAYLNARGPWRFDHHLGHGIGIHPVEAPRISPYWDDVFQEGDVFTLEPGLYGAGLRAGIRLEQNYAIENGKLRLLSTLPLDI